MLRSMCNNFRKWKSSYRVFIVFLSVLVFTFIREDYLKAVCAGCGTSGDTMLPLFSSSCYPPVNYVTMKSGETVRRGRKGSEYYV